MIADKKYKEKVLIVDDEMNILEGFRRQFGRTFQVLTSNSGREGLDILKQNERVAVAIVDFRMPVMNGLEFIEKAKKDAPTTIWIMLSGYADMELTIEAINKGHIFRFLTKPSPYYDMMQVIEEAIEQHYFFLLTRENKSITTEQTVRLLLAALKEKDDITEEHVQRLAELSRKVGEKLNLSLEKLNRLSQLSFMHDLGKIGVPDRVLFKPGKLNAEELVMMRQHPEKGYRIARESPELAGIADLILKHHEHWDGKGYPLGIKGKDIPIEVRILAVVDAYDAMTSKRPYQEAMSKEEAKAEIERCSGSQFDPEVVKIFLATLD